ncbi:MAG: hypothetical protein JWN06_1789 [Propionibacteriaceae bacterium]|jgi:hypothetical protein|nr:hypothetical protein [Propionibacteriaceae bacterium]
MVEAHPGEATGRRLLLIAACLLAALAAWMAWFAWDTVRDVHPGTNNTTGPYELWQGVGAAVTLLILVVLAVRRLPVANVVLAVSVGFTAGFTYSGATDPEADGLYVIGAGMLLVVMVLATTVVALLARLVLSRRDGSQAVNNTATRSSRVD